MRLQSSPSCEVVIPTRNRPGKLRRCLDALADAQIRLPFPVLVCDSSDDEDHAAVLTVCAMYSFVSVQRHYGTNVGAARNACANYATCDMLINVDDDIRVDDDAIVELVKRYASSRQPCAIAGSVAWGGHYSRPVVMRYIGYGRSAEDGEAPSFLVGAFFAYSRELALALPWNERIDSSDDRFMGALWRRHHVHMGYEPLARATHDRDHVTYDADHQASHIYANLFDATMANRDLKRALAYEFLGFAAGARTYCNTPSRARRYLSAWVRGHRKLIRDRVYLREMVNRTLPKTAQ
jgi:glycosyltransferase involved in cell wall biosynthesis